MSKTYQSFKNEVLGKAYDVDGYYGAQCWDGVMYYSKWLGYPVFHCTNTGFAHDIWTTRKNSGILKYYDEVYRMEPGDICVFKKNVYYTPMSHIAIFDSDAGNGFGWFLGQNQGGPNGAFNIVKLPYSATYETAFRPKLFSSQVTKKPENASKTVYWNREAELKVGDTVAAFNLKITGVSGNLVNIPSVGGMVPLTDIYENSGKSRDGNANDNYLANTRAVVNFHETKVQAVDIQKNLIKINGYWVKPDPFARKEYR